MKIAIGFIVCFCCIELAVQTAAGQGTSPTYRNDTARVNGINRLATLQLKTHIDTVPGLVKQMVAIASNAGYEQGVADALLLEGKFNRMKGDYTVAVQKGLDAIKIYEALKAMRPAGLAMLEIAQVYKDMIGTNQTNEYINTGIDYGKAAYNTFSKIADTSGMVYSLNMQGILYRDKAKNQQPWLYDTALARYQQAFNLINKSGQGVEYKGKLLNNISQVYLEHKRDYRKALDYLNQAVAFNTSRNIITSLSFNYGNMSNAYAKLNDHANAVKYARLMEKATLQEGTPARIQNAYRQLYSAFKDGGQMDSALQYYILADSISDALTNLDRTQQVMNLQVQYETSKKELEITRLNKDSADKTDRITMLSIFLAVILAAAIAMGWLYKRVSQQKQQLADQSHRLEVIMKELHHRVKNNLQIVSSLLSLQTYKLHDEETISVLKESQQRVQAMSLIHQRLYTRDALTSVNMKEYITDLAESLVSSYGYQKEEIDLNIVIEKEILDVEKALPLGLLINEMVTNALKYAYTNTEVPGLTIQLHENEQGLTLEVKDNGVGIDMASWQQKGSSFGKQLITVLSRQLRAQQQVTVNDGTRFTIFIPAKAA